MSPRKIIIDTDPGQDDASGGLVLRKQKVAVKSSSTKKNNQKIKF